MDKLCRYFGLLYSIGEVANMLDNLYMKSGDKISTYNMDFMYYVSQLGWGNSILCHRYYQGLPNQIQDPISIQEQEKSISLQDMYTLAITIDYCYWERDCKCYYARQAEKKAFKSHFWKQGKASIFSSTTAPQNKTNSSPVASPTKNFSSKSSPSSALKKQPNTLWVDLSSKLASNSKLTSNKHKKYFENNLCLYCGTEDYKLDSCPKKQTTVFSKGHGASVTASKKSLKK